MALLKDVYESARTNISLRRFPTRASVPGWDELDERVCSELHRLDEKVRSVVRQDASLLANYARVLGEFNRGIRDCFFDGSGGDADGFVTRDPYHWGRQIVRRAQGAEPGLARQFITATHMLAYEFGQLDLARANPFDFVLRNVGPRRADEFGPITYALPVLVNYRRELVRRMLDDGSVAGADPQPALASAPTHVEYLDMAIEALFDPSPDSWIRVAAYSGLATTPFTDGTTLNDEHTQAPLEAALAVARNPITACTITARQVRRIGLAREWLRATHHTIAFEERDEITAVTLWNIYQSTPASRIRGKEAFFGDVVASSLIHQVSAYFESVISPDQTGFQFLRRHFSAFTRGFDSRVEGVVDPRALGSAARGREMSEGLRRFEQGGSYIGQVSADFVELGKTLNSLHHASAEPVEFVLERLEENHETAVAARLLDLFRTHSGLARGLFGENADFDSFSRAHVRTASAFDLLRAALIDVTRAVHPSVESRDDARRLLKSARECLRQALAASATASPRGDDGDDEGRQLATVIRLLDDEFETLVRVARTLVHPLHAARVLGIPRARLRSGQAATALGHGTGGNGAA